MQQGNEIKKEVISSHTSKQDLEILQQLSTAKYPAFFKHCLEKNHLPEHFLQLWNYLSIAEQQAVLGAPIQGERFLTWAIKQVHLPLVRWFLSDIAVEVETQSDPELWAEFRSIRRKTTDHTAQQYLQLLSKLNPEDPLLTRVLLQLSQYYLSQQDHQKAMHYAAGAFYQMWRFSPKISLSLLMKSQAQIQQVLTQCLQSYHPNISPIYFNFFDHFLALQQHRTALKKHLPDYPGSQNTVLWDWFSINTSFFKSLVADLWRTAIHLQGAPPCGYALLGLGSMARDEMCPYSDVECALLIEKDSLENRLYFQQIAALFYVLAMTLGEVSLPLPRETIEEKNTFDPTPSGFHIDDAYNPSIKNMMGTVDQLLQLQRSLINPQEDIYLCQHMLRTVCFLVGKKELVLDYQQGLTRFYAEKSEGFFSETHGRRLALAALKSDADSLVTTEINRRKGLGEAIQIKEELYCLPSQFLSHLTLYYGLEGHSAKTRLASLEKNKKLNRITAHALDDLISQALHLRAAMQLHYACKREEAYTQEKYSSDVSRFVIPKNKALHRLYCLVLSLEEILKQFVQSKGGLDLYKQNFQNTSQVLLARAFAREGSFDEAEKIYHTLTHKNPNSTETQAQQINFYYIQYQTLEHEWGTYKQEGEVLIQQLAQILLLQRLLASDYLSRYLHVPHDCREAFKKAVPARIGEILTKQGAELADSIPADEKSYWERYFEQADAYIDLQKIDLQKKDQALKQAHQPKAGETGLERTKRLQRLNEKRLQAYQTALFDLLHQSKFSQKPLTAQALDAQEALLMCLFFLLGEKLQKSKAASQEAFGKIKNCLGEMIADWQKKGFSEKEYVAVYALLTPFCRKLYREQLLDYQDRAKQQPVQPTQASQSFTIEGLLKTLNRYPDEDGQRADWALHKRQWEATLKAAVLDTPESVKKGDDPKRPSLISPLFSIRHQNPLEPDKRIADNPVISTADRRLCYPLTEHTRSALLTANGEFQAHRILGSQSDVISVTVTVSYYAELHKQTISERRSVYFKRNPKMAGMGYLVERLHHQSIGHGTSLSELVRLEVPGKPPIPLLLSEEIKGENFATVLQQDPQQLALLSSVHFSELALLAMLINPGDGKPANYIWVKLDNGLYRLVSVDHDYALFPAYLLEPADPTKPTQHLKPVLQVRSILFCLDAMHQPIDSQARVHFCQLNPTQVLRQVLQQAQVQNTYYGALFLPEELQTFHAQHVKDLKQGCTIPIPLQKGDMVAVYQKFVRLQKFLEKNPQATLLQCLIQAEPRVGLAYQAVLAEALNPRDRLIKVGAYPVQAGHMITSGSALASRCLGGILTQTNYVQLGTFSPEQGLAELDLMAYQHRQLASVQAEVQRGEFGRFMELLSPEDQESVICGDIPDDQHHSEKTLLAPIRWQELTKHQQQTLLGLLTKIPMQRLYLADCHALTPEILVTLVQTSPNLLELTLDGQKSEQMNQLPQLLNKHPTLRRLSLRRVSELSEITRLQLPALETLLIDDSPKLTRVVLDTPQLKVLRAADCPKLQHLYVYSPALIHLDCRNDCSLPLLGLQLIIPTFCSMQTLRLTGCEKMGVLGSIMTKMPFLLGLTQKNLTESQCIFIAQALEKVLGAERLARLTLQQKAYLLAFIPMPDKKNNYTIPDKKDDYTWIEDVFKIYQLAEQLVSLLKNGSLENKQAVEALILEKVYDPHWQEIIWFTFDLCRDDSAVLWPCLEKLFAFYTERELSQQPIQQLVWLYHLFQQVPSRDSIPGFASFSRLLKKALRQQCQRRLFFRLENFLPSWFQKTGATYQQSQAVTQSLGDNDGFTPISSLISAEEKVNFLEFVKKTHIITPRILSFITWLLLDPEYIRQHARQVLEQLGVSAATPDFLNVLARLLANKNQDVRYIAVEAVKCLGLSATTPEILHGLARLLADKNGKVRCIAVEAIGCLEASAITSDILDALADLLTNKESYPYSDVIEAVKQVCSDSNLLKPNKHSLMDRFFQGLKPNEQTAPTGLDEYQRMETSELTPKTIHALADFLVDKSEVIRAVEEAAGWLKASTSTPNILLRALTRSLTDKDWKMGDNTVEMRKQGCESKAMFDIQHTLTRLLEDEDWKIRSSAAEAVKQFGLSEAALVRLLTDKDWAVRYSSLEAIRNLGAVAIPNFLNALVVLLKNEDKDISRNAIEVVKCLGASAATPDFLRALADLLTNKNLGIRYNAAEVVKHLGASAATPDFLHALAGLLKNNKEEDQYVNGRVVIFYNGHIEKIHSAVQAIKNLGIYAATPDFLSLLARLLTNEKWYIRDNAMKAVESLGISAATPDILRALAARLRNEEEEAVLRIDINARNAIESLGAPAATPDILYILTRSLEDKEWNTRDHARTMIEKLGAPAATPDILSALARLLEDGNSSHGIVETVESFGLSAATPDFLHALARLLAGKSDLALFPIMGKSIHRSIQDKQEIHRRVEDVIKNFGRLAYTLTRDLENTNWNIHNAALKVVSRLGAFAATPKILHALRGLLADKDGNIRHNALEVVKHLVASAATPDILKALAGLLKDEDKDVHHSAVWVAKRQGPSAAKPNFLLPHSVPDQEKYMHLHYRATKTVKHSEASAATPDILDRLPGLLKNKDKDVCISAMVAVGKLGPSAAKPDILHALADLLMSKDWRISNPAREIVKHLGPSAATPNILRALADLLMSKDWGIPTAVEIVKHLGPSAATPDILDALAGLLQNKDKDLPASLTYSDRQATFEARRHALADVLDALEKLGPSAAKPNILYALAGVLADDLLVDKGKRAMEAFFVHLLDVWTNQKVDSSTAFPLLVHLLKDAYLTGSIRCQVYFDRIFQKDASYSVSYWANQKQYRFPLSLVQAQLLRRFMLLIPKQLAQNQNNKLNISALEANKHTWPMPKEDPLLSDSHLPAVPATPIPPGTVLLLRATTDNKFEVISWLLADNGAVLSAINAGKAPLDLPHAEAVHAFLKEGNSDVGSSASEVNPQISIQSSPEPMSNPTSESKILPGTSVLLANSLSSDVLNATHLSHSPFLEGTQTSRPH